MDSNERIRILDDGPELSQKVIADSRADRKEDTFQFEECPAVVRTGKCT